MHRAQIVAQLFIDGHQLQGRPCVLSVRAQLGVGGLGSHDLAVLTRGEQPERAQQLPGAGAGHNVIRAESFFFGE